MLFALGKTVFTPFSTWLMSTYPLEPVLNVT